MDRKQYIGVTVFLNEEGHRVPLSPEQVKVLQLIYKTAFENFQTKENIKSIRNYGLDANTFEKIFKGWEIKDQGLGSALSKIQKSFRSHFQGSRLVSDVRYGFPFVFHFEGTHKIKICEKIKRIEFEVDVDFSIQRDLPEYPELQHLLEEKMTLGDKDAIRLVCCFYIIVFAGREGGNERISDLVKMFAKRFALSATKEREDQTSLARILNKTFGLSEEVSMEIDLFVDELIDNETFKEVWNDNEKQEKVNCT